MCVYIYIYVCVCVCVCVLVSSYQEGQKMVEKALYCKITHFFYEDGIVQCNYVYA